MRVPEKIRRIIENQKSILAGMCEKQRRHSLGKLAHSIGYGGISFVSKVTGYSLGCIRRGVSEVKAVKPYAVGERNRAVGGGRKKAEEVHRNAVMNSDIEDEKKERLADLSKVIDDILQEASYGDPMSTSKWTNATIKSVAEEVLLRTGQRHCHSVIRRIVRQLGYSLQKNQKYDQVGNQHPMRDEQFQHINEMIDTFRKAGDPIISVDTKAKEKLGDFINSGREYRKAHDPRRVLDHDFAYPFSEFYHADDPVFPPLMLNHKAIVIPYGVYCLNTNKAYVSLGIDSDTSEFAADSILNWWNKQGKIDFPNSKRLLILADGGGSNRSSGCLFKIALQQLSDKLGVEISVCHYPPGTSKYNLIEHRAWPHISHAWSAKPLKNLEVVCGYICSASTTKGFSVNCEINYKMYMTEREKSEARKNNETVVGIYDRPEIREDVLIERYGNNPDLQRWNYTIRPHEEAKRWENYKPAHLAS